MLKLAVFLGFVIVAAKAQEYDMDICVGAEDGTKIGWGQDVSCTKYWYCEGEVGYEEECQEGFEFDESQGDCWYDDEVLCNAGGGGDPDTEYTDEPIDYTDYPDTPEPTNAPTVTVPTTTAPTIPSDPSIPDIECPTNRPGEIIFFPSSNCSEYFICANGYRMKMTCMEGFTWNQEEKQCDYPIYSRCSQNIREDGNTVTCTRSGFYSTAYPRDCHKFVFCSLGIPMVQNCPVGYAWNIDRCVQRQFASCPDGLRRM